MKTHTTNYENTFIVIAEDCKTSGGEIPPEKGDTKTIANMHFELIARNPYKFTSDDVIFNVYAKRQDLTESELKEAREQFFSKGQACMRCSPLTKRYGWGIHNDAKGKIALYAYGSEEYDKLAKDKELKIVKAMKSSR